MWTPSSLTLMQRVGSLPRHSALTWQQLRPQWHTGMHRQQRCCQRSQQEAAVLLQASCSQECL